MGPILGPDGGPKFGPQIWAQIWPWGRKPKRCAPENRAEPRPRNWKWSHMVQVMAKNHFGAGRPGFVTTPCPVVRDRLMPKGFPGAKQRSRRGFFAGKKSCEAETMLPQGLFSPGKRSRGLSNPPQGVPGPDKGVVAVGKTSVVSADKTSVVSADKTSVVSADKSSVC